MTPEQTAALFTFLGPAYPRWGVVPATIDAFAIGLADLDAASVVSAARHHQRISQWPPTVAELRKLVTHYAPGPPVPTADEAWHEIYSATRNVGQHRPEPEWSHPLIAEARRRLPGWLALCTQTTKDLQWLGKDFRESFASVQQRTEAQQVAAAVTDLPLPAEILALAEGIGR